MAKKTDDTIWWKNIVIFAALGAVFTLVMVLEYRADDGTTALHKIAHSGSPHFTKALIEQGDDVHAKDKKGWTALHYAAAERYRAPETVEVLLKAGADVHAKDNEGHTALHLAALAAYGNYGIYGDAPETAVVLLKAGADMHAKDNEGRTPLYYAVRENASEAA